jgi:hypothetical protein
MYTKVVIFIVLGIVNIPVYVYICKQLFEDWMEVCKGIKNCFTPEIVAPDETIEELIARGKLIFLVILCVAIVIGEYILIIKLFF